MQSEAKLSDLDTYVFIDVSNIRAACIKSCGFQIDFIKFASYFNKKYKFLKGINYYEGLANNDYKKKHKLVELEEVGYNIRTIQRKSYTRPEIVEKIICEQCGHTATIKVMPATKTLKSNVDVFLATEMLEIAHSVTMPTHIVIVSCDGDYTEAIKSAFKNENIRISVLATPPVKDLTSNTLSTRLRSIGKEYPSRYALNNIENIKDYIIQK